MSTGGKRIFRLGSDLVGRGAELLDDGYRPDVAPDLAIAAAVEQERRRIAADVHDLVMQDLALALARGRMLVDDTPEAQSVVDAAERALAAARRLVCGLADDRSESIAAAVTAEIERAAGDIPVTIVAQDVPPLPQPDRDTFDAIVHIAREAVTNAVKHAGPRSIDVVLECPEEWRLRIRDDGCGFDADAPSEGFGLQSMRRQAQELGGRLRVMSDPGSGTTVVALLP